MKYHMVFWYDMILIDLIWFDIDRYGNKNISIQSKVLSLASEWNKKSHHANQPPTPPGLNVLPAKYEPNEAFLMHHEGFPGITFRSSLHFWLVILLITEILQQFIDSSSHYF